MSAFTLPTMYWQMRYVPTPKGVAMYQLLAGICPHVSDLKRNKL